MEKPAGYEAYAGLLSDPDQGHGGVYDLEEIEAAAEAVRDLQQSAGWRVLERIVGEHDRKLLDQFLLSRPQDALQEAHRKGVVAGVRTARVAADSVLYAAEERVRAEQEAAEPAEGG